jgi:hypothetical protein
MCQTSVDAIAAELIIMHRFPLCPFVFILLGAFVAARGGAAETRDPEAVVLAPGPHLFVDDHLLATSRRVERRVMQPERFLDGPIVTGSVEHQNWQPFLTVLHDPEAAPHGRFRMWYNVDVVDDPRDGQWFGKTGYLESADGIHWPGPYQRLDSLTENGRVRFGASVLDEGPAFTPRSHRYKMLYFDAGEVIGPRVAFSADGLEWTVQPGSILPKTPSDDIWTAGYDPLRRRYFLIGKQYGPYRWTNAAGELLDVSIRRYFTSFSDDFRTWSDPEGMVFSPDERDAGITQWYGAAGFQTRGDLIIGFLRVLRDDLTAEGAPEEAVLANSGGAAGIGNSGLGERGGAGMGYTVLTWTRDGQTWQRDSDTDMFFEPDPTVGAWDHAMAWVGSAVPVGDEIYLYYAGYRWGHKYHHSLDRQFGLVKVRRDRYVAREAGDEPGTLTTRVVTLDGERLTLNADAPSGEIRVQVTTPDGTPIPGFAFDHCRPIREDSLDAAVEWTQPLSILQGRPVRLQIEIRNARLYALGIQ